jgi:hypothetical protein
MKSKKNVQADIQALDMLKDKIYTNDETRDIAIRCVDSLINSKIIKLNSVEIEFEIQDIIHNEINKALNIKEYN